MSWFSADFRCSSGECGHTFGDLIPRADRGKAQPCPACGADAHEAILTAPAALLASYHDGRRDHGARRLAEASRLEAESCDLPESKRGDHIKAIQELTKADGKK